MTEKEKIVSRFANYGANASVILNRDGGDGVTLAMSAAELGEVELLQELVNAGANTNAHDLHGKPVLLYAARATDADNAAKCVAILLHSGADLTAKNIKGEDVWQVAFNHWDRNRVMPKLRAGIQLYQEQKAQQVSTYVRRFRDAVPPELRGMFLLMMELKNEPEFVRRQFTQRVWQPYQNDVPERH